MIDAITKRHRELEEGRRKDLYRDSEGLWTIGIGHLISNGRNTTEKEAREMLAALGKPAPWADNQIDAQLEFDTVKAVGAINGAFPFVAGLPPRVREGVYDMAFQLGPSRCGAFHVMWAALSRRDYTAAKAAALDSLWHEQTPDRCESVAAMIGNE